MTREAQGGFTLIELMVVVAILSILASLSVGVIKGKPAVEKSSTDLALRISDASREAALAGPLPESVSQAEGFTSRTRLFIDTDSTGQYFAVELRQEDDNVSSSYSEIARTYVDSEVEIFGYEPGVARTESGGSVTALPVPYELPCSAAGICGPVTYYLQSTVGRTIQYRVVVLPLSSQPLIMPGW